MDVTAVIYPKGIGKHIICIDACRKAAPPYKQLVGANPEPQLDLSRSNPQKVRIRLKLTTRQKWLQFVSENAIMQP